MKLARLLADFQAQLQGRKIVAVELDDGTDYIGDTLLLLLDDHTVWAVWRDPEGNGPGWLRKTGKWK